MKTKTEPARKSFVLWIGDDAGFYPCAGNATECNAIKESDEKEHGDKHIRELAEAKK